MFFSRLPPPTEKMKIASLASSLLIFSHSAKIVAQPGPFVLLYPKWLPGEHGPGGRDNARSR